VSQEQGFDLTIWLKRVFNVIRKRKNDPYLVHLFGVVSDHVVSKTELLDPNCSHKMLMQIFVGCTDSCFVGA
jgi:hypothetical protein